MSQAPGNIEDDQQDYEPEENRVVVLKWEQADGDKQEHNSSNEKRIGSYATVAQEGLIDKTAKIFRIE